MKDRDAVDDRRSADKFGYAVEVPVAVLDEKTVAGSNPEIALIVT